MESLNTSDDDSLSDDDEFLPIRHSCCRQNLYISQTKLTNENGQRLPFWGLFTSEKLKPGDFVGFYTGEWWDPHAYERRSNKKKLNEYALNTSNELIISPPIEAYGRPDMEKHPISMCNEPSAFETANAFVAEFQFRVDEINIEKDKIDKDRHDEYFPACGLVMCKTIGRNREILWTYGGNPRPYRAGKNCKRPKKSQWKKPYDVLGQIPPCAVPIHIRTRVSRKRKKQ